MKFNKTLKKYYAYITILFIAVCFFYDPIGIWITPEEKTFQKLESALIDWYYKYNPTIATRHNINSYNNEIEKYDLVSMQEYNADLNRFMIELSQIDETKLDDEYLQRYILTESFLYKSNYELSNFNYQSYNPAYSINKIYDSIFFILKNESLNAENKVEALLSRLELIPNCIYNVKKNIDYYSKEDVKKTKLSINRFRYLLNEIPFIEQSIIVNENTKSKMLSYIESIMIILDELEFYIDNDLKNKAKINKIKQIQDYISYDKNMILELDHYSLIDEIHLEMLNKALPVYNVKNDEPVWVDKQDTITVINTILEITNNYPGIDSLLVLDSLNNNQNNIISLIFKESFDRINVFSNNFNFPSKLPNYKIIQADSVDSKNNGVYKIWNNDSQLFLYTNANALNQIQDKYRLDLYNINNCFPGKYFQMMNSKSKVKSINNLVIDKYTNSGWGLFVEEMYVQEGYGGLENNLYSLVHLEKILDLIIKNKMFQDYYIHGKDRLGIIKEVSTLTLYDYKQSELMFSEVIDNPIENNFTIIGYFKLKKIYDKFIRSNSNGKYSFYNVLLKNSFLSPNFIADFRLVKFYE